MQRNSINASALHSALLSGVLEAGSVILDVRTATEFSEYHISGARNIELGVFLGSEQFLHDATRVFVVCKGGVRATKACQKLPQNLLAKAFILDGGMDAWLASGFDVVRKRSPKMPIMQQMQLTIGVCTALTSLLALTLHPMFAVFPLLFGCGLIFAGLSGVCMLVQLLAKMPWNQSSSL